MQKLFIRETKNILLLAVAAIISFCSLHIFVLPSNFSPSGIDGVSTLLFELTGINIGWFKLLINLPIMIIAWRVLKSRYVLYVSIFTLADSIGVILLEKINFYTFISADSITEPDIGYRLIAAIFSGVALGVCTAIMLKIGASTGGVDIIASLILLKMPHLNIERIISVFCYIIIGCSYFVYNDLSSILLSIIQIFIFEWTTASLLKNGRYAFEIKIITKDPEILKKEILYNFNHSATIVKANGMFSGDDYYMIITVLDYKNAATFMELMKKYPESFIYFSDGVKVQGDFHFGDNS